MNRLLIILFCILGNSIFSQVVEKDLGKIELKKDTIQSSESLKSEAQVVQDITTKNTPLAKPQYSPTKAGLYSAVLPGLGQVYNKKYWKVPIVWGGIGTGVGIAMWNQKNYNRYRDAFIAELNGQTHEFSDIQGVTKEVLGRTQDKFKRQRDYSIAVTGLVYVLNIIDAVVDAHLYDQRNDPDLAIKPTVMYDQYSNQAAKAGLSFNFKF